MLDHQTPFCNIFVNFFRLVNTFLIRRPSTECAGPRPGPETRVARERLRASESVRDSAPGPAWGRAATRRRGHPATNGEVSHLFLVMQTNCKHLFSFLGPGPKKRTQGPYINSCGDPARRAAGGLERQRRRGRRARLPMTPGCSFTPPAPAGSRLAAHAPADDSGNP